MKHGRTASAGAVFMILILFIGSGSTQAQSSAHYSLKNAAVDIGGGTAGSAGYRVNGAAGQAGGIGAAAGGEAMECGGFFADAFVLTGVEEKAPPEKPNRFALHQNYPNPFNPVTTIQFEVEDPCRVTLAVYDMLGRQSSLLIDETYQPGAYKATFEASGIPSGVYFYRIRMGAFQAIRKMVVLE